jgi:hypothetical protein
MKYKDFHDDLFKEDYPSGWNKDEFEKISSYAGKLKYANSHLQKLTSGSGRTVFIIDETKVLKMAKNKKGVAQNEVEVDWVAQNAYGEIITKYYDHSDNFYWVEMDRAEKISPKKFEQLVGVKFEDFCDYLDSRSNEPHRKKLDPELMAKIEEKEFPERVAAFMIDFDKGVGDLKRINSYGKVVRDGVEKVVIVDFGLSKQVFDDFYKVGPKKQIYY